MEVAGEICRVLAYNDMPGIEYGEEDMLYFSEKYYHHHPMVQVLSLNSVKLI